MIYKVFSRVSTKKTGLYFFFHVISYFKSSLIFKLWKVMNEKKKKKKKKWILYNNVEYKRWQEKGNALP